MNCFPTFKEAAAADSEAVAEEEDEALAAERPQTNPVPFHCLPDINFRRSLPQPMGSTLSSKRPSRPASSKPTIVPNYVTASGYTEDIPSYPKAGDEHRRDHVAFGAGGKVTWIDFPGDLAKRDISVERVEWSPNGAHCVILIGTVDHKDRDFVSIDPATGTATILFAEHSDAWVGGPGSGTLGWLKDSDRFYFESEKTGFAHLYTYSFNAGAATDLTPGKFFVDNLRLNRAGDKVLLHVEREEPVRPTACSRIGGWRACGEVRGVLRRQRGLAR